MCECDLLIVYASETGTAQDIAECVWRSGVRRRGVRARLACASELDISSLVESVCAPTGVCTYVVFITLISCHRCLFVCCEYMRSWRAANNHVPLVMAGFVSPRAVD
jgi:sulfite reductase alpha subunit-like flavoprotein